VWRTCAASSADAAFRAHSARRRRELSHVLAGCWRASPCRRREAGAEAGPEAGEAGVEVEAEAGEAAGRRRLDARVT